MLSCLFIIKTHGWQLPVNKLCVYICMCACVCECVCARCRYLDGGWLSDNDWRRTSPYTESEVRSHKAKLSVVETTPWCINECGKTGVTRFLHLRRKWLRWANDEGDPWPFGNVCGSQTSKKQKTQVAKANWTIVNDLQRCPALRRLVPSVSAHWLCGWHLSQGLVSPRKDKTNINHCWLQLVSQSVSQYHQPFQSYWNKWVPLNYFVSICGTSWIRNSCH